MILTCPECQTQYDLSPDQLGVGGRKVRCVSCHHIWFQPPDGEPVEIPPPPPPSPPPSPPASEPPSAPASRTAAIQGAIDALLEKDDQVFETILTGITEAEKALGGMPEEERLVVRPDKQAPYKQVPSVITHNPLGVGAGVFGVLTFFLCLSLTLAFLLLAQKPIVYRWPQMASLYKKFGVHILAPGEGLRLSDVIAERRIDKEGKTLVVEGKMTNISEGGISYPPLDVTLKDAQDAVVKQWTLRPGATKLSSGESVPVMLQLPEAPDQGTVVEVRVKN